MPTSTLRKEGVWGRRESAKCVAGVPGCCAKVMADIAGVSFSIGVLSVCVASILLVCVCLVFFLCVFFIPFHITAGTNTRRQRWRLTSAQRAFHTHVQKRKRKATKCRRCFVPLPTRHATNLVAMSMFFVLFLRLFEEKIKDRSPCLSP